MKKIIITIYEWVDEYITILYAGIMNIKKYIVFYYICVIHSFTYRYNIFILHIQLEKYSQHSNNASLLLKSCFSINVNVKKCDIRFLLS